MKETARRRNKQLSLLIRADVLIVRLISGFGPGGSFSQYTDYPTWHLTLDSIPEPSPGSVSSQLGPGPMDSKVSSLRLFH